MFFNPSSFRSLWGSIIREGDKLVPAFPNAIYWSNEKHWQWAYQTNDREKSFFLKENILPIRKRSVEVYTADRK